MAKVKHPLAIVVLPDVPDDATALLEAQGHCLYTMAQVVHAGVTKIDAVVGGKAWRVHPTWWLAKDGGLSAHAKLMLKAATAAAYPDSKPKKKGTTR